MKQVVGWLLVVGCLVFALAPRAVYAGNAVVGNGSPASCTDAAFDAALTTASNGVLIPIQCEYLPLEGLGRLTHTIGLVREHLNPQLRIFGIVMTMFDARTNLASDVVAEVKQHFPREIFDAVIPRSVRLSEAPSYGQPILTYAPGSSGAVAYQALAQELMMRELSESKAGR